LKSLYFQPFHPFRMVNNMTRTLPLQRQHSNRVRLWGGIASWSLAAALLSPQIVAQSPASRIQSAVANSEMTVLAGSLHPLAQPKHDAGRVPVDTKLNGISIFFNRSADQQADLEALLQAQRDPASALYHQWLTPEQFAARFGMADADLIKVEGWLREQGFSIDSVTRSRNAIRFSGTAGQVESAFRTEMHYYTVGGARHFAAFSDLSVPVTIARTVLGIRNLDDFRPHSHAISAVSARVRPDFTSSVSGNVYFAPGDIGTVYDIDRQYSAGFTGSGQTIAIVGQSSIELSDIQNFQNAASLAVKAPTLILMPGTGTPTVVAKDEAESDLDLEWSGAIAPGATIDFVYTGNNSNYSAFDAMQYAIDQDIAPIISASYGTCEADLPSSPLGNGDPAEPTLEAAFQQAAAQGQTLVAASGDDGSTDCFGTTGLTTAQQEALAVDYPASSPYVTGMGGTEVSKVNEDYLLSGYGYWDAKASTDIINTALQYLPEVAWNDDTSGCGEDDCLSSSGGGASTLFSKPSWQMGVPGIPDDGQRDVPDLALNASPETPGYLFCSSDSSFWQKGQTASCTVGFRDGAGGLLTVVGGTSMAAPTFSGMLALINQQQGYSKGQGLVNPTLYTLAANSTTYASAFHDITSGNNDCDAGSADCSGEIGFSAGVGYDQVTGLGTVDLYNLACAWPANPSATVAPCPIDTTTTITAASTSPSVNVSDNFTIAVASTTGTTVPTGTVSVTVDAGTAVSETLVAGSYTYSTNFSTAGNHTVVAAYPGDATHAASTGVVLVTVLGTFSLTPTMPAAIAPGSTATSTVTLASVGGYAGTATVTCALTSSPAGASVTYAPTCSGGGSGNPVILPGATPPTLTFTVSTTAAGSSAELVYPSYYEHVGRHGGWAGAGGGAALALLLFVGIPARRRSWRSLVGMLVLMAPLGGLAGCGGSGSGGGTSNSTPGTSAGTYTFTLSGTGSPTTSSAVTATFTVVVN
jgi:subtilase family serine protease